MGTFWVQKWEPYNVFFLLNAPCFLNRDHISFPTWSIAGGTRTSNLCKQCRQVNFVIPGLVSGTFRAGKNVGSENTQSSRIHLSFQRILQISPGSLSLQAKIKHHRTGIGSGGDNREYAVFLAGGPDGDFNILTQSCEKFHEPSDGKVTRAVPHQQGDLRLLHA